VNRRTYLAAAGSASASALAGCAGVLPSDGDGGTTTNGGGGGDETTGPTMGDDLPSDSTPKDGYPPEFSETPEPKEFDTSGFGTTRTDGNDVSLAPIEAVYNWYATSRARFADARGTEQYDRSHVLGAVSSPVGGMNGGGDPVTEWPTDDRVVCYCGCPHHLSSMRASALMDAGYSDVYVIDEGFWEWHDRSYPMAGENLDASPNAVAISGVANPALAGEYAWAVHEASGQTEAAPIGADGRFTLELRFSGMTDSTPILVRTPEYEVEAPLGDLASGVVRGGK
jgi:rhodanese-related sulfurtransferase